MIRFLQKAVVSFIVVYTIFYLVPFSLVYTKPFYFNHEKLWKHRFLDPVADSLQINEFKGCPVPEYFLEPDAVPDGDTSKSTLARESSTNCCASA